MFSFLRFGYSADTSSEPTRFQQVKEFNAIGVILSQIIQKKDELANKGAEIMASTAYVQMMASERFIHSLVLVDGVQSDTLEKVDKRPIAIKKAEVLANLLRAIDNRIDEFNKGSKGANVTMERKSKYFLIRDLAVMIDNALCINFELLNEFREDDWFVDMNAVTHYGSKAISIVSGALLASPAGLFAAAAGMLGGAIVGNYVELFIKNNIDIGKAPKSLQLLVKLFEAVKKEGIVLEINLGDELNKNVSILRDEEDDAATTGAILKMKQQ